MIVENNKQNFVTEIYKKVTFYKLDLESRVQKRVSFCTQRVINRTNLYPRTEIELRFRILSQMNTKIVFESNSNYRIKDNEPVAILTHITPAFTANYDIALEYLKSFQPIEQWTHNYELPYPLVESYDCSNGNGIYIDSRVSPAGLEVSVLREG